MSGGESGGLEAKDYKHIGTCKMDFFSLTDCY
jgi:hypothetical protein